jgi:hypothetical protein
MYLNLAPRAAAIFENARPSALPEAKQSRSWLVNENAKSSGEFSGGAARSGFAGSTVSVGIGERVDHASEQFSNLALLTSHQ